MAAAASVRGAVPRPAAPTPLEAPVSPSSTGRGGARGGHARIEAVQNSGHVGHKARRLQSRRPCPRRHGSRIKAGLPGASSSCASQSASASASCARCGPSNKWPRADGACALRPRAGRVGYLAERKAWRFDARGSAAAARAVRRKATADKPRAVETAVAAAAVSGALRDGRHPRSRGAATPRCALPFPSAQRARSHENQQRARARRRGSGN